MALIYKITNKITNICYIGKTTRTIKTRMKEHHKDCEEYKGSNIPLYNAVKKYGWNSFTVEIIEDDIPNNLIDEKERYYIKLFDSYKNGYNGTLGGDGGRTSSKLK